MWGMHARVWGSVLWGVGAASWQWLPTSAASCWRLMGIKARIPRERSCMTVLQQT